MNNSVDSKQEKTHDENYDYYHILKQPGSVFDMLNGRYIYNLYKNKRIHNKKN